MADIISQFAIHVGTATALGPGPAASTWHRREADWREKEIRDLVSGLAVMVREARETMTDPEWIATANALLKAHPALTDPSPQTKESKP
jgi:hypothetical protein